MGVLGDIFAAASYGERTDLENPALWFRSALSAGRRSSAGEVVTPQSAMGLPVYHACVRNIAEDVAKLPVEVRRKRRSGRGSDPAHDHPAQELLDGSANDEQLSFTVRETTTHWALGWGRGYAEIVRDLNGSPMELWPIHPSRSRLVRIERRLYLEVHQQDMEGFGVGTEVVHLPYEDVLHIRGLGNETEGYSVFQHAAESIGVGLAQQLFVGSFFGSGTHVGGVITFPVGIAAPSEDTVKKIKSQWSEQHGGARNAFGVAVPGVLHSGAEFKPTQVAPRDAQLIESREFQIEEICRWFRMPPHMVQDLRRGTFSNIEHLRIEYFQDALIPWLTRWEKEIARKLFTRDERRAGLYAKHFAQALLRGDFVSRTAGYRTLISTAVMTPNEARDLEDMNPSEEEGSDRLWMQGAMAPVEVLAEVPDPAPASPPPPPAAPAPPGEEAGPDREAMAEALRPCVLDAARRMVRKEANAAERAAKRFKGDKPAHVSWSSRFAGDHARDIEDSLAPAIQAMGAPRSCLAPVAEDWRRAFLARGSANYEIEREAERLAEAAIRAAMETPDA